MCLQELHRVLLSISNRVVFPQSSAFRFQPVSGAPAYVQAKVTILHLGVGALVPTKELRGIVMYIISRGTRTWLNGYFIVS